MVKPKTKKVSDSLTIMTELVLPNDTNTLNNLMGGRLLHWMDIVGAVSAQKHAESNVVTASVDHVSFNKPIKLGNVVTLKAMVTRTFTTSMEIMIEVKANDIPNQKEFVSNIAYYTFVAVDSCGKPIPVPAIEPESQDECKNYEFALIRRQMRLLLAGKNTLDDTEALIDYLKLAKERLK
jgi:acyl-CoA hydrolase